MTDATISNEFPYAPPSFIKTPVDRELSLGVMRESMEALDKADVPFLVMGSIAFATLTSNERDLEDVDLFVKAEDADRALLALAGSGFGTHRTNPRWIYKATRAGVIVDVIFQSKFGVFLDDEMLARGVQGTYRDQPVRVVPPEDLLVMWAAATCEEADYWHDAQRLIQEQTFDWEYLIRRSGVHPARVASMLSYAFADGEDVPVDVITRLVESAGRTRGQERGPIIHPATRSA